MKLNGHIKYAEGDATNSDQAIKLGIDDQRRQIKEGDLVAIEVHQFEP